MLLFRLLPSLIGFASLVGVGITGHNLFENWKDGLVEKAQLEQLEQEHATEIEIKDKEIELLNTTAAEIQQEVLWARDYVQKQTATIEKLRMEAPIEVQECLDIVIDNRFVQ